MIKMILSGVGAGLFLVILSIIGCINKFDGSIMWVAVLPIFVILGFIIFSLHIKKEEREWNDTTTGFGCLGGLVGFGVAIVFIIFAGYLPFWVLLVIFIAAGALPWIGTVQKELVERQASKNRKQLAKILKEKFSWLEFVVEHDGHGISPEVITKKGFHSLFLLMSTKFVEGWTDAMELLFKLYPEITVKAKNYEGLSLLHIAALGGNKDIMDFLIKRGADPNVKNEDGETPIFTLARGGYTETMKWFVNDLKEWKKDWKVEVNVKAKNGSTPILAAVLSEQDEAIKCLYKDLNAYIDAKGNGGWSPLGLAAGHNLIKSIDCLHNLNENLINERMDGSGETPLFSAARTGNAETIRFLKKCGATIDARDKDGITPFINAVQAGKIENVICLAKLGADIFASDDYGVTALSVAAGGGTPEMIDCLAELGWKDKDKVDGKYKVNKQYGKRNLTALFYAARQGKLDNVKCLVKWGAKVDVEDTEGMTPLDYAGHTDVVNYLRKAHGESRDGQ